ncbi:uncharacterized protein LOC124119968 [Haliotis rufescens]|uniref:uncharacterized protein LOC124119968 n=1 Tax=Haliotis rufescens TaxID=6454 RepID=UPI00201E7578|nr:uncharacterized protein LOC124119968 [Haliotis rufescens]
MFGSLLVIVFSAVQGVPVCEWGKYGHNCDRLCSDHCGLYLDTKLRPCDKDTGTCSEGCVRGRHGDHCDQLCSQNCISTTCNQGNGACTLGCIDGYIGYFCNITTGAQMQTTVTTTYRPCDWGRFGETCDQACPPGCALGSDRNTNYCQTDTGTCTRGCRRGWHGDRCEKLCGGNCIADSCHQGSGHCTHGCRRRYTGEFCEAETGEGHIILSVHVMWMLLVIFILSTICCWRSPRCRRTFDKGFTWLIRRNPSASSSYPSQDLSRRERVPFVPLTTQESHLHASSDPSQDPSQNERDPLLSLASHVSASSDPSEDHSQTERVPLLSTASHATPSQADRDLYHASWAGDLEEVKQLLTTPGVDINSRGEWSQTPVMKAAYKGHRDVVKLLVSEGADVSLVDEVGGNTLHCACMRGDVETVKYVLSLHVVDINSRGGRSWTPVMWAAYKGHREVVELLVSEGADVSLVSDRGYNTLHLACLGGDMETVKYVLSLNVVDINSRGGSSLTPVMEAAEEGHRDVVELLVSEGADVSLVDMVGNNILHLACMGGDVETVKYVLSLHVVDIDARNISGETAADMARFWGHQRVVLELLVSRGAQ